ncbi:protein ABHD1-like [Rhopilema esculentum]|uniref:protein ABHD1-like n=1 Tax=Rhopilema esculentum TaxID=499914 RepID=UPI0031D0D9BC|eukprot:gene365-10029_t
MSILCFLLELSPLCAIVYFYLFWTQRKSSRLPNVSCKKSLFNSLVVQYCSDLLTKPYVPTIWAFLPKIQSVFFLLRSKWPLESKTEYLEVKNGRLIGITWPKDKEELRKIASEERPVVLFIGSPDTDSNNFHPYIEAAYKYRFRPSIFINSNSQKLPRLRHASENSRLKAGCEETDDYQDLAEAVLYITNKFPYSSLYIVSISFGCPTLLKFLASDARSKRLKAAAVVSPAWHKMKYPTMPVRPNGELPKPSSSKVKHSQSLDSFFRKVTKSRYYSGSQGSILHRSTTLPNEVFSRLKRFSVPLLVVFSNDDKILAPDDKARIGGAWKNSEMMLVVETYVGGHAGFMQGFVPVCWAANLVFQYFEATEKFKQATIG